MIRECLNSLSIFTLVGLAGCASSRSDFESLFYSRSEIFTVTAKHFDAEGGAISKALKPTFAKYGKPNGYVTGQMSASFEDSKDRLMGTGKFQAKFKLSKGTYWEIDGHGLTGLQRPIATIHLVYNETDISKFKSVLTSSEVTLRKGQTFTVFEQKVDEQILVTVYQTADIPKSSDLKTLAFAPTYSGDLLP